MLISNIRCWCRRCPKYISDKFCVVAKKGHSLFLGTVVLITAESVNWGSTWGSRSKTSPSSWLPPVGITAWQILAKPDIPSVLKWGDYWRKTQGELLIPPRRLCEPALPLCVMGRKPCREGCWGGRLHVAEDELYRELPAYVNILFTL